MAMFMREYYIIPFIELDILTNPFSLGFSITLPKYQVCRITDNYYH